MSESTQALGIDRIEVGGVAFAAIDTLEVVARYETHLEEEAWRSMERARKWLSAAEYRDLQEGTRQDVATGVYSYGTARYFESLRVMANNKKMAWFCAQFIDRTVDQAKIDELYKDQKLVAELLSKLFGFGSDPTPVVPTSG